MASSHDTVAEALRTILAAIVADGVSRIYTPDLVARVMFWPDESALDPTLNTIYLIRPGLCITKPYDGHRLDRRLEFRILCCHRFTEPTEKPGLADPVREQIAADMEADVVQAIWADVRLGHPELVVDSLQEAFATDFDWSVQSWVICEIKLVVRYQHQMDGR